MRDIEISSRNAKIILTLLKYGCDCLIYLDRSVLRWIIQDTYKERNLKRNIKILETFVKNELKKMKANILKFRKIEDAIKAGHVVNMAFHTYTRNFYKYYSLSGILINVNFLITKILPKAKSEYAQALLNTFINIFKANNDYCTYVEELNRIAKIKLFYNINMTQNVSNDNISSSSLSSLYQL